MLDRDLWEDQFLHIIRGEVQAAIVIERFLNPFLVSLLLVSSLIVLINQESIYLQRWVGLVLQLEESTDDAPDVTDELTVLHLVELELVLEETVLLLENGDFGQRLR